MKASRFSDAQKAFILKQGADGMPVADICRKAGISQATYFNWKKRYDGSMGCCRRRCAGIFLEEVSGLSSAEFYDKSESLCLIAVANHQTPDEARAEIPATAQPGC